MDYRNLRYLITHTDNAFPEVRIVAQGLISEERPMLTYDELQTNGCAALRRQYGIAKDARDSQQIINRRYHLRQFVCATGKRSDAAIDRDFDEAFNEYVEKAVRQVRSPRTQGDIRRGLTWWRDRYRELLSTKDTGRQPLGSFASILKARLTKRGMTRSQAARIAGIPTTTLSSWMSGATPPSDAVEGLRRLEAAIALRPGTLTSLVRVPLPERGVVPPSAYRSRLKTLRSDRYRLAPSDVSDGLRDEWLDLLRYKTSKAPSLERSKRAVWRLTPAGAEGRTTSWYNVLGTAYCAAADIEWRHVAGFLGFLRNKTDYSSSDWAPTLAYFAVPDLLEQYFRWLIARAGGVVNNRVKTLANFVQSLTVAETGWLTQQPTYNERLPDALRVSSWTDACATVNKIATAFRAEVRGTSRDPFEPIRGLLPLDEPLAPIRDAVLALDARAVSAGLQSPTAAVAKRDALLLTILMSIPLRLRNLALLRYCEDGTGTLRKEPCGRWWIRIPPHETKNRKPIDAPLPKSATTRIDEYVAIYRPRLLGMAQNDYVFVASMGNSSGKPWWALNMRVFYLTKTYIPQSMGFHVHTFRHLIATRWLDKYPSDYPTVAHLLGDDLQTVISTYSRPSPARAIDRAGQDIDTLML